MFFFPLLLLLGSGSKAPLEKKKEKKNLKAISLSILLPVKGHIPFYDMDHLRLVSEFTE